MKYITIDTSFFIKEGFGSLMSHYAVMYSIYKDCEFIPTILLPPNNIPTTIQHFNKNITESIYSHTDTFPNLNKIFYKIEAHELSTISWQRVQCLTSNYDTIIEAIRQLNHNICLTWNLTSSLYSKYLNEIISYLYQFDTQIITESQQILPETNKNIVGICVRNEYSQKSCPHPHIGLSLNFYKSAMNQFDRFNTKYLIFSDDIQQSTERFKVLENEFDIEYMPPLQSAIGLCSMSLCDHIICANSSFSYWASLLNQKPNKKIICSPYFINPTKNAYLAKLLNYKWYPDNWIPLNIL
jgi:hypothetical protein